MGGASPLQTNQWQEVGTQDAWPLADRTNAVTEFAWTVHEADALVYAPKGGVHYADMSSASGHARGGLEGDDAAKKGAAGCAMDGLAVETEDLAAPVEIERNRGPAIKPRAQHRGGAV